jgi:transposase
MQFGPSSEKLARQIEQLELRLEDLEISRASEPMSEVRESIAAAKPVRQPLAAELCRVKRRYWSLKNTHAPIAAAASMC